MSCNVMGRNVMSGDLCWVLECGLLGCKIGRPKIQTI